MSPPPPTPPQGSGPGVGAGDPPAPGPVVDQALLDRRYGRRAPLSRGLRTALVVLGLTLAVGATAAVYRWSQTPSSDIVATTTAYTVLSPSQVRVSFEVDKPAAQAVTCLVQALDPTSTVVGEAQVPVPAGRANVGVTLTVATTAQATTANVISCAPQ